MRIPVVDVLQKHKELVWLGSLFVHHLHMVDLLLMEDGEQGCGGTILWLLMVVVH
jgi:hypothetical protein